ncbi:hypothetical protein HDU82_003867 [Entophlyctis luteolus]|nr:hypothetical protein HDU82_003867 [Entophlyctis luteolus]
MTDVFTPPRKTATDAYIAFERRQAARVAQFLVPTEPVLPNALYVALATSAGLVATTTRGSLAARVGVPVAAGAAAAAWWFPQTSVKVIGAGMDATGVDLGPAREAVASARASVGAAVDGAVAGAAGAVREARRSVSDAVKSVTGK